MFDDAFYQIHSGEVFQKSNCLGREHQILQLFQNLLASFGYQRSGQFDRVWTRGSKKIIVCLADDFNLCRTDYSKPPEQWFDSNTTVITDNHIMFTPEYQVCQLPISYFGIFNYTPAIQEYNPIRRFNFSANRIDINRLVNLLEFIHTCGGIDYVLEHDFVNFNAWEFAVDNADASHLSANFLKYWNQIKNQNSEFTGIVEQVKNILPIKNHQLTLEQIHVSASINLILETYGGNSTHAFSEKIFRGLVTPAPWMLHSAKHAIKYLSSLGFDTLDDLIDHGYNDAHDYWMEKPSKSHIFMTAALKNYENLNKVDFEVVKTRCLKAAQHNQQLLAQMQQQWPADFSQYLTEILPQLC